MSYSFVRQMLTDFHSQRFPKSSRHCIAIERESERRRCIEMERVANLPIAFGVSTPANQPARRKTLDVWIECRAGCGGRDANPNIFHRSPPSTSKMSTFGVYFIMTTYCHWDEAVLIASAIPITRNIDRCVLCLCVFCAASESEWRMRPAFCKRTSHHRMRPFLHLFFLDVTIQTNVAKSACTIRPCVCVAELSDCSNVCAA